MNGCLSNYKLETIYLMTKEDKGRSRDELTCDKCNDRKSARNSKVPLIRRPHGDPVGLLEWNV